MFFCPRLKVKTALNRLATQLLPTGTERILMIDDEKALVDMGKQILERLGYQVETRTSPL